MVVFFGGGWGKRGDGDGGVTGVEVWFGGVRCGRGEIRGGEEGWRWVGGRVGVKEGGGSTMVVTVGSEGAGQGGWEVWVDDVGVVGC